MNYTKHYDKLISRARNRVPAGYYEAHHVVPRCMGGTDASSNIVNLTPEEHYVAHQLLVKMFPGEESLVWATMIMTGWRDHQPRKNKMYGWLRRLVAAQMRGKPKSPETREKLRLANLGKRFSAERCANISAGKIGKNTGPRSAEWRASISRSLMGKSPSAETREKMRLAKLGKKQTPEHIAKCAKTRVGRKHSAETRAKLSAAGKKRVFGKASAETRLKMRESHLRRWALRKQQPSLELQ